MSCYSKDPVCCSLTVCVVLLPYASLTKFGECVLQLVYTVDFALYRFGFPKPNFEIFFFRSTAVLDMTPEPI